MSSLSSLQSNKRSCPENSELDDCQGRRIRLDRKRSPKRTPPPENSDKNRLFSSSTPCFSASSEILSSATSQQEQSRLINKSLQDQQDCLTIPEPEFTNKDKNYFDCNNINLLADIIQKSTPEVINSILKVQDEAPFTEEGSNLYDHIRKRKSYLHSSKLKGKFFHHYNELQKSLNSPSQIDISAYTDQLFSDDGVRRPNAQPHNGLIALTVYEMFKRCATNNMRLPRRTVENLAYLLSFYFKNKDLNCNPRTLLHAFGSLTKHTDLDDDKDVGHDVVDGDEEKGMVNKKRNTKRMSQEDLEGLDENSDYDNMKSNRNKRRRTKDKEKREPEP